MTAERSVFRSVGITVAMRWTVRLIGFVSTIVLARLLVPEDFGIVAQAYMVIALTSTFMDFGVELALIQNREATPAHYDTAWTLRIAQALVVASAVFVAAPLAGSYFHDPRVVPVIRALSIGTVLGSLENIWVTTFQKEMKFELDFKLALLKRMWLFVLTVGLAAVWRSYWALVVAQLTGTVAGVLISYRMHDMRPRLSVSRLHELYSFSHWLLVRSIGNYFVNDLHRLLVGGRASTETMGAYSVANSVAAMPTGELLAPLYRALFPAFVRAREQPSELKRMYLLAQGLQAMLVVPIGLGMALVAPEIVPLLLGTKWMQAVPFLQTLALCEVGNAFLSGSGYILLTMGKARQSAVIAWSQVLSLAAAVVVLFPNADALEIARLRVASVVCGVLVAIWMVRGVLPGLRNRDVAANAWRPVLAAMVMAAVLLLLDEVLRAPAFPAFLVKVFVGATVYVLSVLVFWILSGRPAGAETYAMERIGTAWGSLKRRSTRGPR